MALGTETHFWDDFFVFEAKYMYLVRGIMGLFGGHISGVM